MIAGDCVHEDDDFVGCSLVSGVVGCHAIGCNFEHVLVLVLRFVDDYSAGRVKCESRVGGAATANDIGAAFGG